MDQKSDKTNIASKSNSKATKPKMTLSKKLLIAAGIIIGFLVVVALIVIFTTTKERDLATKFVNDISTGNTNAAYSQFSNDLKKVQDQPTFEKQIASLKLDSSCKLQISGLETNASTDAGVTKTITGSIKCNSKTLETAEITYGENTQIFGYSIQP